LGKLALTFTNGSLRKGTASFWKDPFFFCLVINSLGVRPNGAASDPLPQLLRKAIVILPNKRTPQF